jgi:O-antigen/teichoic acid export membrane protein
VRDPRPHPPSPSATERFRETVRASVRVLAAEALAVPTGIVVVGFLARRLGAEGYGEFTLAAALVAWLDWSIASALSRASVTFVAQAPDRRTAGAAVVRTHLVASLGAAVLLWTAAPAVAAGLGRPGLVRDLRLFVLEMPVFALAQAHRSILIGMGSFNARAVLAAARWIARMIGIVVLVGIGFGIPGAIVGALGASVVELAIARRYVRPPLLGGPMAPAAVLLRVGPPLAVFDLGLRAFDKVDLFCLMALTGSSALAGFYGAAQNLSMAPGMFAMSFSPLLLSTLARTAAADGEGVARPIGLDALRIVIGLVPFAAMAAGASREITALVLGEPFLPAAAPFALLVFGEVALAGVSVCAAILTAAGKPAWTFALSGPMVVLALAGNLVLIPRLGAIGAALVTTVVASLGSLAALVAVHRVWTIRPPVATVARSAATAGLAYLAASLWSTPGLFVLAKLAVISTGIVAAAFVLGEWRWPAPEGQGSAWNT